MKIAAPQPGIRDKNQGQPRKKELELWSESTRVSAAHEGIKVALSLPEDCETGIRKKGIDEVELKGAEGLNKLIALMDQEFLQDEASSSSSTGRKGEKETMQQFISNFNANYLVTKKDKEHKEKNKK